MITINDLQEKVSKANSTSKARILRPADVAQFVELVNEKENDATVQTIRVYSSDGFVPNSYKYRADISYLQATRNAETGKFEVGAGTVDAKRSRGNGALVTINSRAL